MAMAQSGSDKKRLMTAYTDGIKHVRPWSIPDSLIKHFGLRPVEDKSFVGFTVIGEDGKTYLLDDVIYMLCHVAAVDLSLEK